MKKVLIIAAFIFVAMSFTTEKKMDTSLNNNTANAAELPEQFCMDWVWMIDEKAGGLSYEVFSGLMEFCEAL